MPRSLLDLLVFAVALSVYLSCRVIVLTDSIWVIPTASSLWQRGDTNLDEYAEAIRLDGAYGVIAIREHSYNYFPLGTSLAALPLLAVMDLIPGGGKWQTKFRETGTYDHQYFRSTERAIASIFVSLAVAVFFSVARRRVSLPAAAVATALFAFGTSSFSTASRTLWQHGPSLLAITGLVSLLCSSTRTRPWAVKLGLTVAAAFVLRPTNAVPALGVSALMVWQWRRLLPAYLVGTLAVAAPFCALNWHIYEALLPPYYLTDRLSLGPSFLEALAGNLVSPSRGLFVFSPVLLLAVAHVAARIREGRLEPMEWFFAATLVMHWLTISSFPHWWGGHSVGPRFFTDVLPFFAYFLLRPLEEIWKLWRQQRVRAIAVVVAAAISIIIHSRASITPKVHAWNDGPPNVDDAPERIWNWREAQVFR